MADGLAVWLYGSLVATIDDDRRGPRLTYTDDALHVYAPGTPLLSLSLPVRPERFPQGVVKPFLDGLLPEGGARRAIARAHRIGPADTYGLVDALGRDCAGAVVIQPADEAPPPPATTRTAEALSDGALAELVENLREAPLGAAGRVRVSLAGIQQKLVLTRMPDGRWGRPVDATPSTHILKPEIARYPGTVENEAFSMRVARRLGLPTPSVETMEVAGRKLIVIERYDRIVGADGAVERLHQEDFCQATATRPDDKYQEDGGPSLRTVAGIVDAVATRGSIEVLLAAVTVHAIVGNGDAHAKNYSLLHQRSGALRLAPIYDLMCTQCYGDDRLAMTIDDVRRTDRLTAGRLINEGVAWGVSRHRCAEIVTGLLDAAPAAIDAARDETPGVPDVVIGAIESQLSRLRSG